MDRSEFWKLIDSARSGAKDDAAFMRNITAALRTLGPERIVEFERAFNEMHAACYTWKLWGAAYLLNGGCSDDGFDYFRAWLIAQGQRKFDASIEDPDSLADWAEPESELEEFLYVALNSYREKTGKEMPTSVRVRFPELGKGWDFDDPVEMKKRYPKLSAL